MLGPKGSWNVEVIPDSEEEQPMRSHASKVTFTSFRQEVIEISSDSSEGEGVEHNSKTLPVQSRTNTSRDSAGSSPRKIGSYMRSRVVESSDSDSGESEGEGQNGTRLIPRITQVPNTPDGGRSSRLPFNTGSTSLYKGEQTKSRIVQSDLDSDNEAILVFDEPKTAHKPRRLSPSHSTTLDASSNSLDFRRPFKDIFGTPGPVDAVRATIVDDITASASLPKPKAASPKKRAAATPRLTTKKRREEERMALQNYAAAFFKELNRTVFDHGLPEDTQLNWNKRLLTTAGRAKWHRSREGVQTSEIELAEKILTSYGRIRNTLSHEMCHLASWVIDKEIKEGHGRFWKGWTRKVMSKYPDIGISTRHNYEIEYPYKWKCAKCAKIYGRFSKSIKPNECVCGACREGRLIPQFESNARTPKRISKMAATKGQDSPCYTPTRRGVGPSVSEVILISSGSEDENGTPCPKDKETICEVYYLDSESDSEIEILVSALKDTAISAS